MNSEFPKIDCTVDVVIVAYQEEALKIGLIRRHDEPYQGQWALPGGYVHAQEDRNTLDSAKRVLLSKVGLKANYLEQLYSFSGLERDPRGFSISVTYLALLSSQEAQDSELELRWFDAKEVKDLRLAFDHNEIVQVALERMKAKAYYTELPAFFLPEEFTLGQLQKAYETVSGQVMDKHTFRRHLKSLDVLEKVWGQLYQPQGTGSRPAQVYRLKTPA